MHPLRGRFLWVRGSIRSALSACRGCALLPLVGADQSGVRCGRPVISDWRWRSAQGLEKALARRGPCLPAEPEGWIRRPPSTGPAALRLPPEEHSRALSDGRRHMR